MRTVKYDGKIFAAPCLCDKRPKPAYLLPAAAFGFDCKNARGSVENKVWAVSSALSKLLPKRCPVCQFYPWIVLPK